MIGPTSLKGEVLLALEAIGERLAGELLEDEEVRAVVGRGDLDQLADVRALDRRGDARLALEAAHEVGLHRRAGEEDLDGDVATATTFSRGVAGGGPDLAHPPRPSRRVTLYPASMSPGWIAT